MLTIEIRNALLVYNDSLGIINTTDSSETYIGRDTGSEIPIAQLQGRGNCTIKLYRNSVRLFEGQITHLLNYLNRDKTIKHDNFDIDFMEDSVRGIAMKFTVARDHKYLSYRIASIAIKK